MKVLIRPHFLQDEPLGPGTIMDLHLGQKNRTVFKPPVNRVQ